MTLRWRSRGWLLMGFAGTCLVVVVWMVLRPSAADLTVRWPARAAIDTLASYVAPTAPMPPLDDYAAHLPALPASAPRGPAAGGRDTREEEPQPTRWRVSAILISGGRPTAIVDDQPVRPGSRLNDGTVIESIETDRVIVTDEQGRRHTLRISAGE